MRGDAVPANLLTRRACTRLSTVAVVAAVAALAPVAVGPVGAMLPGSPNCKPPDNHQVITDVPWPVRRYSPQRIWPVTRGQGVTVAVIDSGVDANHPQLRGRVDRGKDFLDHQTRGTIDCVGHGTGVASIIAAAPRTGVGFTGLAPGVRILPVRVSEVSALDSGQGQGDSVDAAGFADAIDYAVAQNVRVINLSVVYYRDDPLVRAAIANAVRHDVVVVAAAGNAHNSTAGAKDPVPYPAAYAGVLGVGAIDQNGVRDPESQVGPYVDLAAAGLGVTMAANQTGDYWVGQGTSFAAPLVAGAAALVRARYPDMTAEEVVKRLEATADPEPGGTRSDEYGYGEVDPYRAVNEVTANSKAVRPGPIPLPARDAAAARAAAEHARALRLAVALASVALLAVVIAFFAVVVLPRGRRRGWRPGLTPVPTRPEATDDGMYTWSLGPPPALPHPDREVDEELVRMLRRR